MLEKTIDRIQTEHAVLDIGGDVGALVLYYRAELNGQQIEISPSGREWQRIHTLVRERRVNKRVVFAALFLEVPAGEYAIWGSGSEPVGEVSIKGGEVTEIDWSSLLPNVVKPLMPADDPLLALQCAPSQLRELLPARYQAGQSVSAAPMGSAPMRYNQQGEVAWDQMWTDFCDLALAGGPPHRGTLLEPVRAEEVWESPEQYRRVVAEIERGLRLVSNLPLVTSEQVGWVGVECQDEQMALWLLRAIIVENVSVRREEKLLFLPAGPNFQLEKEIKNVITVVAKTYHYWSEHIGIGKVSSL
jgi:hypothetical protein